MCNRKNRRYRRDALRESFTQYVANGGAQLRGTTCTVRSPLALDSPVCGALLSR